MMKGTPKYNKLNKVIRKKTRNAVGQDTELIKTISKNHKSMKVLRMINTRGRLRIHQLKDTNRNITEEKSELINIIENFYKTLYRETISKLLASQKNS